MSTRRFSAFVLAGFLIAVAAPDAPGFDIETSGSVYPTHAADGDWRVADPGTGNDAELQVGITGAGSVSVTNGATLTTPKRVWLGYSYGVTAGVSVNGAAWVAEDHVGLGNGTSSVATVDVTDGTWTVAGSCYIGAGSDANGTVNLHGGAVWTSQNYVHVGHYGIGAVNVDPNASWTAEEMVSVGFFSDGSGRVNLNGGNWTSQAMTKVGHLAGGEVHVNAGSTLKCAGLLNVTELGEVMLDGGVLHLAGGAELAGSLGADAGGGTVRIEIGSAEPDSDLCLIGEYVNLARCVVDLVFDPGFVPGVSDSFNLFDPIGSADLSALLGAAATISIPADWQLDLTTGVMSHVPPPVLPGDANGDGVVDAADYVILKRHMGTSTGDGASGGDFDGSGKVDWADLQLLMAHTGDTLPGSPAEAPEPCSAMLVLLGGATLMRRRARAGRASPKAGSGFQLRRDLRFNKAGRPAASMTKNVAGSGMADSTT